MINEKTRLKQVVEILKQKIKENKNQTKSYQEKLKTGIKNQGENFSEISRGDDLSTSFDQLSILEGSLEEKQLEEKRLKLQLNSPYFARIDFLTDNNKTLQHIYIGIGSIIENKTLYAIDWRAPVASMYYDYNLGDAQYKIEDVVYRGTIELKRQFKIENGNLISFFDTDLTINDDILQDILSNNVSVKMKQIVSSIQKEQNAIVRNDTNENMLVQGIAGSGKTSIALHRAAYLLYKHRKTIKSNDITIISPNNIFSSYISEVLPQLGENNLVETTFAQIVRIELKKSVESREEMLDEIATAPTQEKLNEVSYKSSYEYLDDLLRFLKGPYVETFSPQNLSYVVSETLDGEKETIDFPAEQTKELFFKTFKGFDL